jgi:hypothetical protein
MLIHYSIASFELLERKLTDAEKQDVFDVFHRVDIRMELKGLPGNYTEWVTMHEAQLRQDLVKSHYTVDLYKQYRKLLSIVRYKLLKESQKLVCPVTVKKLLGLGKISWITPLLWAYKLSSKIKMDRLLKSIVMPHTYRKQIKELDIAPS